MQDSCLILNFMILYPPKNPEPDNFQNATAIVVTFLVNNYKNDTFQDMALTWEKAYLNYIKNFSSPNFTISYSAEVGNHGNKMVIDLI